MTNETTPREALIEATEFICSLLRRSQNGVHSTIILLNVEGPQLAVALLEVIARTESDDCDECDGPECPGCTHPGNCVDCEYPNEGNTNDE